MAKIFQEIKSLNLPEIEAELLELWDEEKTFAASMAARDGGPTFTFYEGPPTANGRPGIFSPQTNFGGSGSLATFAYS